MSFHAELLGKDVWIEISNRLEEYFDWNRLRSSSSFFRKLLTFLIARARWARFIDHPIFDTPKNFVDWVPNLRMYDRVERGKIKHLGKQPDDEPQIYASTPDLWISVCSSKLVFKNRFTGKRFEIESKFFQFLLLHHHVVDIENGSIWDSEGKSEKVPEEFDMERSKMNFHLFNDGFIHDTRDGIRIVLFRSVDHRVSNIRQFELLVDPRTLICYLDNDILIKELSNQLSVIWIGDQAHKFGECFRKTRGTLSFYRRGDDLFEFDMPMMFHHSLNIKDKVMKLESEFRLYPDGYRMLNFALNGQYLGYTRRDPFDRVEFIIRNIYSTKVVFYRRYEGPSFEYVSGLMSTVEGFLLLGESFLFQELQISMDPTPINPL